MPIGARAAMVNGMMLLFAMQPMAQACESDTLDVVAISPEDGAVDVPRDAQVVLHVRGEGALDTAGIALLGESGPVPGSWDVVWAQGGHSAVWSFTPAGPLLANRHYLLDIAAEHDIAPDASYADSGWGAGFATSESLSEEPVGSPTLAVHDVGQAMEGLANRCEPAGFRRARYDFRPVPVERPSENWFHLYLIDGDEDVLLEARRLDARRWDDDTEVLVPSIGQSFCLVGAQRGPSGHEVRSEPACFSAPEISEDQAVAYYGGGARCSTTSAPVLGALWGFFLLGSRRRSRP